MDDNQTFRVNRQTLKNARKLRSPQTPAEAKLWVRLRSGQIYGLKFRRQHPIGPYIVDFYCAANRLVIEIDGDTHVGREEYDAERARYLEKHGYRVIRFCNNDVHENIEGVLEAILSACSGDSTLTPCPSPFQGEGS